MLAALAVLVSHSFYLTTGKVQAEPLYLLTGMTLGTIAVHCFFVMSGFLVTDSLLRRQSLVAYAKARVLRVFPALLVMLLLTVFGLGMLLTQLPVSDYLSNSQTWQYFLRNLTLIAGVTWTLPGIFESNPHPSTFNGSLWTLTYELRLYIVLAFLWWLAGRTGEAKRSFWLKALVLTGVAATGVQTIAWHGGYLDESQTARLGFMFFSGAAYQLFSRHIRLDTLVAVVLAIALVTSVSHQTLFLFIYLVVLPYLLLWLAYVPGGMIRSYNRLGDYSYGLYIYAFVVQQTIVFLMPAISAVQLIAAAGICSLLLAVPSWHLVEARALKAK